MLTASELGYTLPGGRRLFDAVNLVLGAGEAVAIQGPSGTGKSTLLALLGRLLVPTTGSVRVEVNHRAPYAWALQTLNSLGSRTALDNARLYSFLDGEPTKAASVQAAEMLERVGLAELSSARARQLSGGELQRLSVARALASTRPILLADEPTNQLDPDNARRVMEALFSSTSQRRCVVVVTHDREALPPECRVLRLTADGLRDG